MLDSHSKTSSAPNRGVPKRPFRSLQISHLQQDDFFITKFCGKQEETYFGLKTLVFEVTDTEEGKFIWGDDTGLTMRVMNGWWSTTYADDVVPTKGYWELQITEQIAKECAKKDDGGEGRDLDLLMTRGRIKIKACYYEY